MSTELPPSLDILSGPYNEHLNMTLSEWREGFARMTCVIAPHHINRSGIVHGGVFLSMIDQCAAYSGIWCSVPGNVRRSVTIDLDCRFTGQVKDGVITAVSTISSRGRSIYFCRTDIYQGDTLVAFGASTHKWRKGSEDVTGMAP